jgi:hypothetical protein
VRIYDLMQPLKEFPKEKVAGYLETLDIWDLRHVHTRTTTARRRMLGPRSLASFPRALRRLPRCSRR